MADYKRQKRHGTAGEPAWSPNEEVHSPEYVAALSGGGNPSEVCDEINAAYDPGARPQPGTGGRSRDGAATEAAGMAGRQRGGGHSVALKDDGSLVSCV